MSQYRKPDQLIEELDYQNQLRVAENKRLREALEHLGNYHRSMTADELDKFICDMLGQSDE